MFSCYKLLVSNPQQKSEHYCIYVKLYGIFTCYIHAAYVVTDLFSDNLCCMLTQIRLLSLFKKMIFQKTKQNKRYFTRNSRNVFLKNETPFYPSF